MYNKSTTNRTDGVRASANKKRGFYSDADVASGLVLSSIAK